jgi:aldehyde:ferredoxin oxidoreductase
MVDLMTQTDEALGIEAFDRFAGAEKALNVARHQDWRTLSNALVMCLFANVDARKLGTLVNRATGFDYSLEELLQIGERGWNLKRLINGRLGLSAKNDRLPPALLSPYEDGPVAGRVPPLEEMLQAYYEARQWDPESGMPLAAKVEALGLNPLPSRPLEGLHFEPL